MLEALKSFILPQEVNYYSSLIEDIQALKREKNAVILAHNYQPPIITKTVADFVGDSLQLAQYATTSDASILVQAGVYFMAETSKILNPEKTVLIPDKNAGCSLASSIGPEDIIALRKWYPKVPIVAYVNTTAAVKAMVDICCTSSNAVKIIESLNVPRVIVVPDKYLGKYIQEKTSVEIIRYNGACEVHEKFTPLEVENVRRLYPDVKILTHPECRAEVNRLADFTGSTSALEGWIEANKPDKVALVSECSMADNLHVKFPNVSFLPPCGLCPHMQRITLEKILISLQEGMHEVTIPVEYQQGAKFALEEMLLVR